MRCNLQEMLRRLPGPVTSEWPGGEPFTEGLRHGSLLVEVFASRGLDTQSPHEQDELYVVVSGTASFEVRVEFSEVASGDALFVPDGDEHRFHRMSTDFVTWVVFWGPTGGESQ